MNIIEEFCQACGVSLKALLSKSRQENVSDARNIYCYIRRMMGASYPQISTEILRSRSTIIYAVNAVRNRISIRDPITMDLLEKIRPLQIMQLALKVEQARTALKEAIDEFEEYQNK